MDIIYAIILGMVQGLTEFLPVSSSAHLVFFQNIMGTGQSVAFDTVLHMGTLAAVVSFFFKDIIRMIKALVSIIADIFHGKFKEGVKEDVYKRLVWLLVVGTIPAGLMGILLKSQFESMFNSVPIVGFFLLVTGVLLWASEHHKGGNKDVKEVSFKNALAIGVFQGFAIAPGISRSGSTIAAGLFSGLNRELAARYSFLLSIPAILGAALVQAKDIGALDMSITALVAGFISAVVFGYLAIKLLMKIIKDWSLNIFAYYCWIVGAIAIILSTGIIKL
ncbi:undecaprenyl-diphosphate phosphatase [Methanobacterium aggregans]|uniref:undecaprenyl-diphosphate phosphatase n=1 Tax=Methanobacterium aggregans TaxID=1615586 RepID=UPI001AE3E4B2|nr:undecaprenyl-diphosphate phosphatase [Methanobacterium aggregans]MBP2045983.1 undecaprenyl-diphosphatase [Methanobacterium aggregans]